MFDYTVRIQRSIPCFRTNCTNVFAAKQVGMKVAPCMLSGLLNSMRWDCPLITSSPTKALLTCLLWLQLLLLFSLQKPDQFGQNLFALRAKYLHHPGCLIVITQSTWSHNVSCRELQAYWRHNAMLRRYTVSLYCFPRTFCSLFDLYKKWIFLKLRKYIMATFLIL